MSCPYRMAAEPKVLEGADVALYLGKRGTGKSTRAKALAGRCMRAGWNVVALDYHDEWSKHGHLTDQVTLGPLTQRLELWQVLADPDVILRPKRLCAAVVPSTRDPRAVAAGFARVMALVSERGETMLAADEVGTWGPFCQEELDTLACNSRHNTVPLVLVSQRAKKISLTTRSQSTHINSGLQTEPQDLDALAEVAGQAFADSVSQLGPFQWCHWTDTGATSPRPPQRKRK